MCRRCRGVAPDMDQDPLDAYSAVVVGVAKRLRPSVVALSVRGPRGGGAGSAVVFTADGFMLTSAHVVADVQRGEATFADGAETRFDVIVADQIGRASCRER